MTKNKNPITHEDRRFLREWIAAVEAVWHVWPDNKVHYRQTHTRLVKYACIMMAAARLDCEPERVAAALASSDEFRTSAKRWGYLDSSIRQKVSSAIAEVYRARKERVGA